MSNDYRQRLAEEMEKNPFTTLIDAIYTIILHDIISYKYVTGDHIKEAILAEEFGVSRSPIRTTINRLAEQVFVVKEKNAVAVVKAFTPQERSDLIQVRRTLEPTAMAYAAQRMTDAEFQVLETTMKKLSVACLAGDMLSAFGIEIEAIPAYSIGKPPHYRENNWLGYVVLLDGVRYYIAGDTDNIPEARSVKCDVAFLSVGGESACGVEEAVALANAIAPSIEAVPVPLNGTDAPLALCDSFRAQLSNEMKTQF